MNREDWRPRVERLGKQIKELQDHASRNLPAGTAYNFTRRLPAGEVALVCPACGNHDSTTEPADKMPCSAECGTDRYMVRDLIRDL